MPSTNRNEVGGTFRLLSELQPSCEVGLYYFIIDSTDEFVLGIQAAELHAIMSRSLDTPKSEQ